MTRRGKIARLPRDIREEVNERLLDNEPGSELLPWLNALPRVKAVLKRHFKSIAIDDENLSQWRKGGFSDWKDSRDLKETAAFLRTMAKGGKVKVTSLLREVAAIKLLGKVRDLDETALIAAAPGLAKIIDAGTNEDRLSWQKTNEAKKHGIKEGELALKRLQFAQKFRDFYLDERAKELAEAARDDRNLPALADYLFGVPDASKLDGSNG